MLNNNKDRHAVSTVEGRRAISIMNDGTFEWADETGLLSDNKYHTVAAAERDLDNYLTQLYLDAPTGPEVVEMGRRLALAEALRGIRGCLGMLLYSTENVKFHQECRETNNEAGGIMDHLNNYIQLLEQNSDKSNQIDESVPF